MTRFDYQVQVTTQVGDDRATHRMRTFVGTVKASEELDPSELGTAAAIEALQGTTEQLLEGAGRKEAAKTAAGNEQEE